MAIKISKAFKALPIAVVSDQEKEEFCKSIGAKGTINRKNFNHWGRLPNIDNSNEMKNWTLEAKRFLNTFYEALGTKRKPRIIFEHSGQDTIPTSIYMCDTGGMIVICGGTSGYNADVDLRYLWVKQKRLQGSHFANPDDCIGINNLVQAKKITPTIAEILNFEQIGLSHQKLLNNQNKAGSMVIKVGIK
jgi:crotonyl-CoA carboxylase/reductase